MSEEPKKLPADYIEAITDFQFNQYRGHGLIEGMYFGAKEILEIAKLALSDADTLEGFIKQLEEEILPEFKTRIPDESRLLLTRQMVKETLDNQ